MGRGKLVHVFKVAVKSLRRNLRRLIGTFAAIFLGVSFMAGVLILGDTTRASYNSLFATAATGIDAVVRAKVPPDTTNERAGALGTQQRTIPTSLAPMIAGLPGVAALEDVHESNQGVVVIGTDGRPVPTPPGRTFVGTGWPTDARMNPYTIDGAGRPPEAANEVALDVDTAAAAGATLGRTVTIRTPKSVSPYRITALIRIGDSTSAGTGRAVFSPDTAAAQFTEPGRSSRFLLRAEAGTSQAELAHRVRAAITSPEPGLRIEVLTGDAYVAELRGQVANFLDILSSALVGFAGLSLVVGAFVISNTFSILVTQQIRELALLRAVGASGRQVLAAVLAEASVLGLVASVAGTAGGAVLSLALRAGFDAFGLDLPTGPLVVTAATIGISIGIGFTMAVICAYLPARRAARVPPMAALGDIDIARSEHPAWRLGFGLGLLAVSGALLWWALARHSQNSALLAGAATACAMIGTGVLGPRLAGPLANVAVVPLRHLGISGVLAGRNAVRNPRRSASTATAIMIGVASVVFVLIMADTLRSVSAETTKRAVTADVIVTADQLGLNPLPAGTATEVEATPGVRRVGEIRFPRAQVFGTSQRIAALDRNALAQARLTVVDGSLSALGLDGIAVASKEATKNHVKIGDSVPVVFGDGVAMTAEVRAIVDGTSLLDSNLVVSTGLATQFEPNVTESRVLVDGNGNISVPALVSRLEKVPLLAGASVTDISTYARQHTGALDQIIGLFLVMLALTIVIALFGVTNTLSLSIRERTRELGLLRAVGTTRGQVSGMIRLESLVLATVGVLEGLDIGLIFGWGIGRVLLDDPQAPNGLSVVMPWKQIFLVVAVGLASGIFTSIAATRRAGQLNVLEAIQAD